MSEIIKVVFKPAKNKITFNSENILHLLEQKGTVITLSFVYRKLIVVADASAVKHIFIDNPNNYKRSLKSLGNIVQVFGENAVGTLQDPHAWKKDRETLQLLLSTDKIKNYAPLFSETVTKELDSWEQYIGTNIPFFVNQRLAELTTQSLSNALFKGIEVDAAAIVHAGTELIRLSSPVKYFTKVKFLNLIPLPGYFKLKKTKAIFNKITDEIILRSLSEATPDDNIIKHIAKYYGYPSYNQLTDKMRKHLRDEATTFLISAHVGATSLLAYANIYLSLFPNVAKIFYDEINKVLGPTTKPTYEIIEKLPYVRAFVKEVLRLHPPAKYIPREAMQDDNINGYPIKKNDLVLIHIYSLHRMSKYWPNPDTLDPSRFLHPLSEEQQLAYMPFGKGERSCLGAQFITVESILTLVLIAQRYRLTLPPGAAIKEDPELNDELERSMIMNVSKVNERLC